MGISERSGKHKMVLHNKVVSKDILEYLQSCLPHTVAKRHNHNTYQSSNIIEICKKEPKFYSDNFLCSAIKL